MGHPHDGGHERGHGEHGHHHGGHERAHGEGHGRPGHGGGEGGTDTRFLDLEASKVLYGEAEGVVRDALRTLLLDAAKRHLETRMGERIDALAALAVDELLGDLEANLGIEARIRERSRAREGRDERIAAIFRGPAEREGG